MQSMTAVAPPRGRPARILAAALAAALTVPLAVATAAGATATPSAPTDEATQDVAAQDLALDNGLKGEYFLSGGPGWPLTDLKATIPDQRIEFPNLVPTFAELTGRGERTSARWTGQITPDYSEAYTFSAIGDNGFRLWIDDRLVIDHWVDDWDVEQTSAPVQLQAGQEYAFRMEMFQNTGGSHLRLRWQSPSQQREIVPTDAFTYPDDFVVFPAQAALESDGTSLNVAFEGAAGGVDALIDTTGGGQQDRVVGGTQRIALELAGELGDAVRLGSPVTEIAWTDDAVTVRTAAASIRARHAVVAVPPPLAARIGYTPGLPGDRDQLVQRMPMGRVIKVNVAYDTPFWREKGLSGQVVSDRRPFGIVYDNTPPSGAPGVLVGFLEGRHADAAARLDPATRRARVLEDLASYFGSAARNPIAFLERDWAEEEYTRGCYGAFTTPGALTRFGHALRAPVGALHWAGTETATRWPGYIDGAVESGVRAAHEIMAAPRQADPRT